MRDVRSTILLMFLFCLAGAIGSVQASDLNPEAGRFLVAKDSLTDPRFQQSVILLIQHDEQGTAGVIVNRPSRLELRELFGGRSEFDLLQGTLFYGGPVSPQSLFALVWDRESSIEDAEPVLDEVVLTGPERLTQWVLGQQDTPVYRIFTGYAGWAPGQLASEMDRGDWRILPATAADIFSGDIEQLWAKLQQTRVL